MERGSSQSSAASRSGGLDGLPDDELIFLAKTDREAFAVFYRRHLPGVLAYFAQATRSPELALDLAGETFASALLALPRYERTDSSGASWLYTIARSRLIDVIRKGKTEARARDRLALEPITLTDDGAAVVRRLIADGEREALRSLVDGLPEDQREVIAARFIDEQDYADIAAELRCSEQAVRKRVSRALNTLRNRLDPKDA